jgi:hypothetical protein
MILVGAALVSIAAYGLTSPGRLDLFAGSNSAYPYTLTFDPTSATVPVGASVNFTFTVNGGTLPNGPAFNEGSLGNGYFFTEVLYANGAQMGQSGSVGTVLTGWGGSAQQGGFTVTFNAAGSQDVYFSFDIYFLGEQVDAVTGAAAINVVAAPVNEALTVKTTVGGGVLLYSSNGGTQTPGSLGAVGSGATQTFSIQQDTQVIFKETANGGYVFDNWVLPDGTTSTASTYTTVLSGSITVEAVFSQQGALTLTVNGDGWVTATPAAPADQNSGGEQANQGTTSYWYNPGTTVTLQAYAYSGWQFSIWGNGDTNPTQTVQTTTAGESFTATFTQTQPTPTPSATTETVTFSNQAGGTISFSDSDGYYTNGAAGTYLLPYNDIVAVSGTANSGYTLTQIVSTGAVADGSSSANPSYWYIRGTSTFNAEFSSTASPTPTSSPTPFPTITPLPTVTISPSQSPTPSPTNTPSGSDTLTISADPTQCSRIAVQDQTSGASTSYTSFPSTFSFNAGDVITTRAYSQAGYSFSDWSNNGNSETSNPYTTTWNSNAQLTANFALTSSPTPTPSTSPTTSPQPTATPTPILHFTLSAMEKTLFLMLGAALIASGILTIWLRRFF